MLVDFLWQNLEKTGDSGDILVKDLWNNKKVYQAVENDRAITAFLKMQRKGVSGLAVVDQHGKLVDNLSYRDYKKTSAEARNFWCLWDSVKDFKAKNEADMPPKIKFQKPLYVLQTDTLFSVIEKMTLNHVHRIYVVNNTTAMKPIGIISQTDLLMAVLRPEKETRE